MSGFDIRSFRMTAGLPLLMPNVCSRVLVLLDRSPAPFPLRSRSNKFNCRPSSAEIRTGPRFICQRRACRYCGWLLEGGSWVRTTLQRAANKVLRELPEVHASTSA